MLNDKQLEIANFLLKYLESKGGKSNLDDYPEELKKRRFDYLDSSYITDYLIENLGLIKYWGEPKYWIVLTPEGYKASSIGLQKYFEEIEQDKQLDRNSKKASIDGIKKANKNSKRAIIIAVIIPLLIAAIQIYFDNRNNSIDNRNNNSSNRPEINHSQFPFNRADTLFIEKIKNSLKHDTVFLNDIKSNN